MHLGKRFHAHRRLFIKISRYNALLIRPFRGGNFRPYIVDRVSKKNSFDSISYKNMC